jgi:hypothetical protein
MDEHVNLFVVPMTEKEQLELSDLLDEFTQLYENDFDGCVIENNYDATLEELHDQFKGLYDMVKDLDSKALDWYDARDHRIKQMCERAQATDVCPHCCEKCAWNVNLKKHGLKTPDGNEQ